jgi:DNA-binding transcriptional LysR family regulator
MRLNLNHLAIFHAVAETGSMTLGAERLDISQPAVSKQVQELESALHVDLFHRIGRRIHLTQAGEILADYARRLFALARAAEEAIADVRAVERGTLRIGASTTIGSYLLPAVVATFWRQHPKIELLVQIENTEQVQRRLAGHELDVGLTEGFVEEDELSAETFHRDELVVIASTSHRFAAKGEVPLSALRAEPFILREAGSGTRAVEERALARLKLPLRTAMALGSTEAIKRVVAEGVGLAIVSRLAVRAECAAGTLAVLPVAGLRIDRPLHLVRRKGRRDGPALQAFCSILRETTAAQIELDQASPHPKTQDTISKHTRRNRRSAGGH